MAASRPFWKWESQKWVVLFDVSCSNSLPNLKLIWAVTAKLWTLTCQNLGNFLKFQQKEANISVKNHDIENPKTWTAVDVCFYEKQPYQWYDACPWIFKHKHVKKIYFSWFFGRKSPLFSLKIEISKIRKHQHVAEDVCFDLKSSYGESHANPERSVGAVWGHPPFSEIQNGRRSAILNLIIRQIMGILTLTYIRPLIQILG